MTKTKQKQVKLLLDDSIKSYRLNANEACIYACIAKCTRAGKGWYGNYAALADAMPFEIGRMTASRAVQKLLTLGLIERREENRLFTAQNEHDNAQNERGNAQNERGNAQNERGNAQNERGNAQNERGNAQNERGNAQNERDNAQNEQKNAQIDLPPITPLNNNNMNELKNEERETHVHTHDEHVSPVPSFSNFMDLFRKTGTSVDNDAALHAYNLWQKCTIIKQKAMVSALSDRLGFRRVRPDWFIADFPEPQPIFLSGIEQDNARAAGHTLVQVIYNGAYKICTKQTADDFNLKIIRIW